ncbi:MAG: sigma-70 family RNA polymerase sigma factor [Acidimicrobiia bacterium]
MNDTNSPPWDADDVGDLKAMYPKLRSYAAVIARGDMEPDDLVQEAMTRWLLVEDRSAVDAPIAYLRRSMLNLVITSGRRNARWQDLAPRALTETTVTDRYPSDLEELKDLRPEVRALLYAHVIDGATIKEAAVELGMTDVAARVAVHRAKKFLRAQYEGAQTND